ncbi:MAG TPA: adenylate/guanylate cyclase domain-containing protein [Actinomycetota bacterium]|nr:adenylate/guanylate cyclase domain-containing protein [Actinomycetota bacterium]
MDCPACGRANTHDARFCSGCGTDLAASGRRKERKFATALFADLVGSTTLAEREDPEVVQTAIGGVFDRLAKVIDGYGGLLEKYMGDAILAVFGVPVAHEDDSERAIRAALDMQAVLSEMNRVAGAANRPQLEMRIGIESGDILVDVERAGSTRDRMLTGDAVNTAARLQSSSEVGRVLVGPTAYASTKGTIDFSEPITLDLKGKAEPVPAYTALRITAHHAGERAALGIESRMIGRDAELSLLQQTLHRVEKEGRPALVTILAPAGSGKSRLVRELGRYMDDLDKTFFWRSGRCLPYGSAAYSGLADAIQTQCEVLDDDAADVASSKVERSAQDLVPDDEETADALKILLGLHPDRSMGREKLFDLCRRYLEGLAARYPLVLVLEDIHWADEGLLDFIGFLADWGQGGIMIVTLARPELLDRRPAWGGGKRNYAAIYLDPLDPKESDEMLSDLLGGALPDEAKALIAERTEGNPLFTEEIVRMFIDREILRGSHESGWVLATTIENIDIPRSIQALIAARIDGLPGDEKSLLQDAAVVGRIFWSGVVSQLAEQDITETRDQLARLRLKELITQRAPSSFSDEDEFGFHHALIRDVAYESLPKKLRADKHIEVAAWAESGRSSDRDDVVELIATHLDRAVSYMVEMGAAEDEVKDLQDRTYRWVVRAAEAARRLWQVQRALDWYRGALDVGEQLGRSTSELAVLFESYANLSFGVLPHEVVLQAFQRALEGYEGRETDVGRVQAARSRALFETGQEVEAIALAEEAVALLREKEDTRSLAQALISLARLKINYGVAHAIESASVVEPLAAEAAALASQVGDTGTECSALKTRGQALSAMGKPEEGLELAKLSFQKATETGDLLQLLDAAIGMGYLLSHPGDADGAGQRILEEALELARRHGQGRDQVVLAMLLMEVHFRQGRFEDAEAVVAQAAREAPHTWSVRPADLEVDLARLDAYRGDLETGHLRIQKALSDPSIDSYTQRAIRLVGAVLAHLEGDDDAALVLLREGTAEATRDLIGSYPQVIPLAVELSVACGEREEARAFRNLLDEPGPLPEAFRRWCDGLLALDLLEASKLLTEAAALFEGLRVPLFRAECLVDLARVNKEAGLNYEEPLQTAIDFFDSCGAPLLLAEAMQIKE